MVRSKTTKQAGFTLIEMMIAIVVSLIVVLALGRVMTLNQKSWSQTRERTLAQQNVTSILDRMARSLRQSRAIVVTGTDSFNLLDEQGNQIHAYSLGAAGGDSYIQEDGVDMAPFPCTHFSVSTDVDTTSVQIELELTSDSGFSSRAMTRIAQRATDDLIGGGGS